MIYNSAKSIGLPGYKNLCFTTVIAKDKWVIFQRLWSQKFPRQELYLNITLCQQVLTLCT
jgi:hypothetical protein